MHYFNCLFCAYTLGAQERIQLETARLYKQAGVNPLAGKPCFSQEGIVCSCNVIRCWCMEGNSFWEYTCCNSPQCCICIVMVKDLTLPFPHCWCGKAKLISDFVTNTWPLTNVRLLANSCNPSSLDWSIPCFVKCRQWCKPWSSNLFMSCLRVVAAAVKLCHAGYWVHWCNDNVVI